MKKNTQIEIIWLTALALTATAVSALLTGFNRPLFLSLSGMGFALSPVVFAVGLFLFPGFLVFGTRAVMAGFQNRPANFIFFGFAGIAILGTAILLMETSKLGASTGHWTAYPPYSKFPSPGSGQEYGRVTTWLMVILATLILVVTTTVVLVIRRKKPIW